MKARTMRQLIFWAIYIPWAISFFYVFHYRTPSVPKPISVQMPTERSIQKDLKNEQRQKQYVQASKSAYYIYHRNHCSGELADVTGRIAVDSGVPSRLLAALVYVESSCNPNAVSGKRSIGLTQVNPLVWNYTRAELRDPERNLRIGATILSAYVRKFGLVGGLHHYNGLGNPTNDYADKVLTAAGLKG